MKTMNVKTMKEKKSKAPAGDSILGMYFKEINRIPMLDKEEEETAARAAARGNTAARDRLINGNLRFVVNVAKKYQGHGLPLEDLINEGNIGLMQAVERFNVTRGYRFISYAVWWIRQSIVKALYEKARFIRMPANWASDLVRMSKARELLSSGDESEIPEIAQLLDVGERYVSEILSISGEVLSLDKLVNTEKGVMALGDCVMDQRYDTPEEAVVKKCLEADIAGLLDTMDNKEAEILRLRYGFGKRTPLSLKEIGIRFNLTKERIRQIEINALKHLRRIGNKVNIEDYVA